MRIVCGKFSKVFSGCFFGNWADLFSASGKKAIREGGRPQLTKNVKRAEAGEIRIFRK
jgi:hypothetical protein